MIFRDCGTACIFALTILLDLISVTWTLSNTTSCPTNTVESPDGYCYKAFAQQKHLTTWPRARNYCRREEGGDLVSIQSKEENDFIAQHLNKFFLFDFWIGLNDMIKEGDYQWSDGSNGTYRNWASFEPDDQFHNEDCAQFSHRSYRWSDRTCYFAQGFVCKWKKGAATPGKSGFNTPVTSLHCPNNKWRFFNHSCYFASPHFGNKAYLSWYDARDYCYNMSSQLVSIHSLAENNMLLSMISKSYITAFWTGLNEFGMEYYQWIDGSSLDFVFWDKDQPSDSYGGEDCVGLVVKTGLWDDINCAEQKGYMCKKDIGSSSSYTPATTKPHTGGCPQGFHAFGSKCFSIQGQHSTHKLNWSMAAKSCKSMGRHFSLVSIHSEAENAFLVTLLRGTGMPFWTGLNDLSLFRFYEWQDNTVVGYTKWDKDQPSNAFVNSEGERERCVEISGDLSNAGKWNDDACYNKKGYICQTFKDPSFPAVPQTPDSQHPGYMYYGTSHYKLDKTPRSWKDSLAFCISNGGNVVSVSEVFEQAFVFLMLQGSASPVWIGLSDSKMIGLYGWSDDWPVEFTYWGDGEPSVQSLEGCVVMMKDGTWNDTVCSLKFPVICEINTVPPPKTTPGPPGYCPSRQMKMHGDNCYFFSPDNDKAWSDAYHDCQHMGMNLVSIHSADDMNFVYTLVKNSMLAKHPWMLIFDVWIGLTRSRTGGFEWVDGTPVDYVNWDVNEPANSTDSPNCIYSYNRKWKSFKCIGKQLYVCQTKKILPNPTTAVVTTRMVTSSSNVMMVSTSRKLTDRPNNILIHDRPESSDGKDPVTSVGLAFIFIGCILALIVVCIVIFIMKRKQMLFFRSLGSENMTSFDNVLFTRSRIRPKQFTNDESKH